MIGNHTTRAAAIFPDCGVTTTLTRNGKGLEVCISGTVSIVQLIALKNEFGAGGSQVEAHDWSSCDTCGSDLGFEVTLLECKRL